MQHCHHIIALSQSLRCGTLSIIPWNRAFKLLSDPALFYSPTTSSVTLPIACGYTLCSSSAGCLFSSLACISSNCLLVSTCNASPQHWPASEGLHNTRSFRPLLNTSILCSGHNNLPKSVPGFYTSLLHGFSLRERRHWLLGYISVLKTQKAMRQSYV